MEQLPLLIVIGIIAGIMSGMFGIGGGAIIVPALMIFLDFSQVAANGTSLAALLLPVGIFACVSYYRAGKLKPLPALMVALGLASGTWFGATVAIGISPDMLRQGYGVFLIYMAWRYVAPRKWLKELRGNGDEVVADSTDFNDTDRRVMIVSFIIGMVAGLFSGLFGIGGGVVIVPALMIFLRFDLKLATGTSLGALLLPVALPGVIRYAQDGLVEVSAAIPIAIMLMLGAILGAKFALGLPVKTVRRLYGFFLLFVGLRFLLGG